MAQQEAPGALRADIAANRGYAKSLYVMTLFRACQALRRRGSRLRYGVVASIYKLSCEWILWIENPPRTSIVPGLRLRHRVGTVINTQSRIEDTVALRQRQTLETTRT